MRTSEVVTDVSLRDYVERRLDDLEGRLSDRFISAERALEKAEASLQEYKTSSNEWRGALRDAAARMVSRAEHDVLSDQIQELRREKANLDGRLAIIAALAGSVGALVGGLAMKFLR